VPVIGILGVAFPSPLWMPIVASAIALTLLPIAYITFFLMSNRRSYLGEAVGAGIRRVLFNTAMIVAIVFASVGSAIKIKTGVINKLFPPSRTESSPAEKQP
jgi:hypothetical protein